jgi:integrase
VYYQGVLILGGFGVRLIVLEGGERLPVLVDRDGFPMFRPAVWMMTMRRAVNLATATLKEDLQALKVLYGWSLRTGQDIEDRMLAGEFLSATECASLVDAVRQPIGEMDIDPRPKARIEPIRTRNLESNRMRQKVGVAPIGTPTAATRLRTIIQYLKWLADEGRNGLAMKVAEVRVGARDEMLAGLVARIPKVGSRNLLGKREAPPPEVVEALLRIVELDSPENPWRDLGLRVRNRLLIHLLFGLGIRRGELLGIRVDRIDFQGNRLLIARCPDDPMDSRKYQPLTKTRDRWLPMKGGLVSMVQEYVTHVRSKLPKARKHPYLLVSHRDGAPLAMISVNKLFVSLRGKFDDLPEDLSPHLLRHAWNDAFSRLADSQKMDPAREQQMRSEMMGWSPTSGTAATYSRRHTREAAEKLSLKHQEGLSTRNKK